MDRTPLFEQLRQDEGFRRKMYRDQVGVWTIGVGHNLEAKGISTRAVEVILEDDVEDTMRELFDALPWSQSLSDARRGVLINMCFNLGLAGLLKFENMLGAIQAGEWAEASKQLLNSKYAAQVGARAKRLAKQLITDEWQMEGK